MSDKQVYTNLATERMQRLIKNIALLEQVDRQRMSQSGKHYLDEIWKALGMPTYDEAIRMREEEE
mgnify:FL=1|tara:strand:- start:454 stop:648 length:195 start_codon:yes stop_codon:yes gene_type:complete